MNIITRTTAPVPLTCAARQLVLFHANIDCARERNTVLGYILVISLMWNDVFCPVYVSGVTEQHLLKFCTSSKAKNVSIFYCAFTYK